MNTSSPKHIQKVASLLRFSRDARKSLLAFARALTIDKCGTTARNGFCIPSRHTKQKAEYLLVLCFCWCGRRELNPYDEITRPSNVRVCQFRHSRRTLSIITRSFSFVNTFFKKNKNFFEIFFRGIFPIVLRAYFRYLL